MKRKDEQILEAFIAELKTKTHILSLEELDKKLKDSQSDKKREVLKDFLSLAMRNRRRIFWLSDSQVFLWVHVRSEDDIVSWGLYEPVLEELDIIKGMIPFYIILLVGRNDRWIADGYILTSLSEEPLKKPPLKNKKDTYLITEGQHLEKKSKILGLPDIVNAILSLKKGHILKTP